MQKNLIKNYIKNMSKEDIYNYIEKNGYDNIEENQINSTCIIKENSENE